MNKFFILALLGLSLALACHQSCNCAPNSNVCESCKLDGAEPDENERSCPCPRGQFLLSLSPYQCQKLTNVDEETHKDVSEIMDACHIEIGRHAQDVKVFTDCHFENQEGNSVVISNVSLNHNQYSMSTECKNAYVTFVEIQTVPKGPYNALNPQYVTPGPEGSQYIKFPLIDIYSIAINQVVTNEQIVQTVNLRILIGHSDAVVRKHRWQLFVYTNRDQVETFVLDVDVQETEGCQPGQECIIIADLENVGKVYTDVNFNVQKTLLKYLVGDIFYAKITFADPTYTKQLQFQKLYFKNAQNKIFNFSSITHYEWKNGGLEFYLPLVEPTQQAVIQINMKIITANARRLLASDKESSVQQKFTLEVAENNSTPTVNSNQTTNSMVLLFSLMNFVLLFLF